MSCRNSHRANLTHPALQILDSSTGSVRLARECPRSDSGLSDEERDLLHLQREQDVHDHFTRLFLLTTEQYLKGALVESDSESVR
ncbi:MAG: hypothetical protein UMU75_12010 [Halomonas sp.]|nr:hypothetical protein [Halomonas sp.]